MADKLTLSTLSPARGSTQPRRRVGRGPGSGLGKTAGKGHKGHKARTGGSTNPHNMVRATMNGLTSLVSARQVARERGVELDQIAYKPRQGA